jgi:LysM repeat protein
VGGAGIVIPVTVATPNADGDVIHEVKPGQSLWQIAITYNAKIDEIKRLNDLYGDDIYPGTKLLIRKGAVLTPPLPSATREVEPPSGAINVPTPSITFVVPSATPVRTSAHHPTNLTGSVLGIIALAFLGGWLFAILGNSKR